MTGLIIKALSGFYYVEADGRIIECKARGKFRNDGITPLVGDRVEISLSGENGTVDSILERKNCLDRPPVANIDKLFIVSSAVSPKPNLLLIDRMTALCEFKNITPVIVFNKCDEGDLSELVEKYSAVGYRAFVCSAKTKEGIEALKNELEGCISAFTGNSGVGKSSILNVLFPAFRLSTGAVSEKLGRGRHTTRHSELFSHGFGGYVADTPGFSSLESDLGSIEFKEALDTCFPEFEQYLGSCRFADCKHIGEKGCAVCAAVASGSVDSDRYSSYVTVCNELKDIKPWMLK